MSVDGHIQWRAVTTAIADGHNHSRRESQSLPRAVTGTSSSPSRYLTLFPFAIAYSMSAASRGILFVLLEMCILEKLQIVWREEHLVGCVIDLKHISLKNKGAIAIVENKTSPVDLIILVQ